MTPFMLFRVKGPNEFSVDNHSNLWQRKKFVCLQRLPLSLNLRLSSFEKQKNKFKDEGGLHRRP